MVAVSAGITSFVVLLVLLLAVDRLRMAKNTPWAKRVRRLADGTFAIYLMHFPLLVSLPHFLEAPLGAGAYRIFAVGVVVCALLVWVALPLDAFKRRLRRWLRTRLLSWGKPIEDVDLRTGR